ncbi:hypothetical protein JHK86_000698 [Glycine max]|nr:hypothetical protein JHK86_000698 [Glycine max]
MEKERDVASLAIEPHFCPQFNKHSLSKLPNNKTPKPSSLRCHLKPESKSKSKSNTKSYRPSANARTEVRRNRYKVVVDADEGHRRQEDTMVEIRKNRREESLQKKRCEGLQSQQIPSSLHSTVIEKKRVLGIRTTDKIMIEGSDLDVAGLYGNWQEGMELNLYIFD